jgi:tetratricopeptide (TPR) repeat protein
MQSAQDLIAYDELRPGALEILGRASMAQGELEVAEKYLRGMVALLPEASTGHYWLGINLFRQQKYQAAVESLERAHRRNPEPRVAAALLDALLVTKQWSRANSLAGGLVASPEAGGRAIGWAFKAGIHRAQGEPEAAIDAYRQALREDPKRAAYALAAADLLIDSGQYAKAEAVLADLAVRDPGNRIVRFKQGYAAQLSGNAEVAVQRYRELLEVVPGWALVLVNLSELLSIAEGTRVEALAMAQRAAKLSPDWDRAHWNLAQRAFEAGDRAQASKAVQRVLALSPQDTEAQAMAAQLGG